MRDRLWATIFSLAVLTACGQDPVSLEDPDDEGPAEVLSLGFHRAELSFDQWFLVHVWTDGMRATGPLGPVILRTSGGRSMELPPSSPDFRFLAGDCIRATTPRHFYRECSNDEIIEMLEITPGEWRKGSALLGVKEADQVHGRDPETGAVLFAQETAEEVFAWLASLAGVELVNPSVGSGRTAIMLPLDPELIGEIRSHPNLDYLEPNRIPSGRSGGNRIFTILGRTTLRPGPGIIVSSGDTLFVSYRQPDGSRTENWTLIR
jgi:hypothetical protein